MAQISSRYGLKPTSVIVNHQKSCNFAMHLNNTPVTPVAMPLGQDTDSHVCLYLCPLSSVWVFYCLKLDMKWTFMCPRFMPWVLISSSLKLGLCVSLFFIMVVQRNRTWVIRYIKCHKSDMQFRFFWGGGWVWSS